MDAVWAAKLQQRIGEVKSKYKKKVRLWRDKGERAEALEKENAILLKKLRSLEIKN